MNQSLLDTTIAWPPLSEVVAVLTLQSGYNTAVVLLGVSLLGAAAGMIGTFAVLRKRALMSDTLSHAALPGLCLAFLVALALGSEARSMAVLLGGAAVSGIVGVLCVQALTTYTRLPEDAAMGAVLSVFFGAGFVLLSHIQTLGTGAEGGIAKFIYGQTAAMTADDALIIGVVALGVLAVTCALFKEFRLACFDPQFAETQGWPVGRIDLIMMALVVVVTVIGLRAVGLIMIVALIIIPAAAARFWTERLLLMTILAALFGAASGYLGGALSALFPRFPAGGVIVLTAGALFLASFLFAPARGLVAGSLRMAYMRLKVGESHILRTMFEAFESGGRSLVEGLNPEAFREARGWPRLWFAFLVRWLCLRGRLAHRDGRLTFTNLGHREALRITRNHRLWEQFLVSYADLAPSRVDRSADLVEHVLSPEMMAELEQQLTEAGRLPRYLGVPPSVHPLEHGGSPA